MKRLFNVALSLVLLLVCICTLSACFNHEHTYSDKWSSDDEYHWHDASCKHTTNISDKQEHTWDVGVLKSGDECGEGSVVLFTCTVCNKTVEKEGVDHNYLPTGKVEPTCTKLGYTSYSCTRCSSSCVADFVEAVGHNFSERVVIKSASCTVGGSEEESCSLCGKVNEYGTNATGHKFVPVSDDGEVSLFECEHCEESLSVPNGESVDVAVGDEEIFDVDSVFSFDVTSEKGEEYIKNNLKIVETYFIGTEYEDKEALCQYTLVSKGDGVYTVTPVSAYEYDTTYSAIISGDVGFSDYKCRKLNFTIDEDENHENSYEYNSGIIFLKELENTVGGYYPFSISSTDNDEYLYLTVRKISGIEIGQILCVGEVSSFEEIDYNTECYFGKVDSFYNLPDGSWMIVLAEPAIEEIFSELDISFDQVVDFDSEEVDVERVENELIDALYADEDFIKFLASVNVATIQYFGEKGYDTSEVVNVKSFMDYVKVKPKIDTEGTKMFGEIVGNVTIPIKDNHKNEIGKFELTFTLNLTTEFNVNASYKLKKKWGIPYGINYFDVGVTQTDTFTFDFKVSIEVDYSTEEQPYVQNIESGKIHRRGCVHLRQITDYSKLKGLSAIEMKELIDGKASLECKHCRPSQSFDDNILYVNTDPRNKVIHKKGCAHAKEPNGKYWVMSDEKATYWIKQGYQCCEWCHPDNREEIEYGVILDGSIYHADWQQICTDITQLAKDAGMNEHAPKKGITIVDIDIPIYGPIMATVEVDFVFSFKLEASITYKYQYQQTNTYGMRISGRGCSPYSSKTSKVLSNELNMMGKVNVKVGLLIDVYININGLSKWVRAGVTAEIGLYADLYGVLHKSPSEFYAAAYFEAGIYIDIEAYYKLFKWSGNVNIYEDTFPLTTLGFDRAYFAYDTYHDKLEINGSYDIDENDLLKVKYFNLKTMETAEDELRLNETKKYRVVITFEDGRYCEIKNGFIVIKSGAPANFTDTMIITVECDTTWKDYQKGKSVYYLGKYEIELEFGDGDSHTLGSPVTENAVDPTCTDPGYFEHVYYCIDEGCGKEIKRESQNVDPLGHDYTDGVCERCGAMDGYSEGLDFTSNGNNTCYLSGLGSCTDVNVKIPPMSPSGQKVTAIGDFAIYANDNIVSITIPEGVVSIGSFNFYSCRYLKSIAIPLSLTTVASFAFDECIGLKTVYYKGTGSDWSNILFYTVSEYLEASTRYYYSESAPTVKGNFWHYVNNIPTLWPEYDESNSNRTFEFTLSEDGTYYVITGMNDTSVTSVTIPTFYGDHPVKEIADYAFIDCSDLVSVTVSDSITLIHSYAFVGCDMLKDIIVDENNANYKSDDGNLYSKDGKVLIQYARAKSETSFTIPTGVTVIGEGAFMSATKLESITIPVGVTEIANDAFYSCSSLKKVYYTGSEQNWSAIEISESGNEYIIYAEKMYNCTIT